MGGIGLLVADFILSFMWVWSSPLIKILVSKHLGLGYHDHTGEIIRYSLSILNLFLFSIMAKINLSCGKGGAYNPLTVLAGGLSGNFSRFLFSIGARIPAQVLGSIMGVRLLIGTFPEIGRGPKLNVHIYHGALTEGFLTFAIVFIQLGLGRSIPGSFFRKTWIASLSKLTLHILGSDLTGGCMNPASVFGWAYARGDHITKEHIFVYWLAPIEGTLFALWVFKLLFQKPKEKADMKNKSD
uniref:Aquaporin SIP n=1 Tax=Tamarix hispida TaxID=189793 RepID=A0A145PRG7_9CARY|nr:aquaporin SIP [Tamarix hispida]